MIAAAVSLASIWGAAGPAHAATLPPELYGDYVSTFGIRDGEPNRRLFQATRIDVSLAAGENHDFIRIDAECNVLGARMRGTGRHLVTWRFVTTLEFCGGRPAAQDRWLYQFFASEPAWRSHDGGVLTLTAGERVLTLRGSAQRGQRDEVGANGVGFPG